MNDNRLMPFTETVKKTSSQQRCYLMIQKYFIHPLFEKFDIPAVTEADWKPSKASQEHSHEAENLEMGKFDNNPDRHHLDRIPFNNERNRGSRTG
jgi:hypothetical protein